MKKILIVEDVDLNMELLVQLLEDDYELLLAQDGATGLALAVAERPDLVLMDMSLPVMDGWEATRRIKAEPGLNGMRIIGLSAHAMAAAEEQARAAGCDDYLTKPVDDDLLLERIQSILES
jgi:two-component system, cell cycle response regulator DivK